MPSSSVKELLMGFCLGTANIIPGVSGGTFLLIFNIYERVFSILNNINPSSIYFLLNHIIKIIFKSDKMQSFKTLTEFLKKNDFIFLFKLLLGAVVAIIAFSSLMEYLMVHHFSVTYALFFGLILVSIVIPVKMLKVKKAALILFVVLGAAATIYVTYSVNPYDKIKKKSDILESQYVEEKDSEKENKGVQKLSFTGKYTLDEYGYVAVCGAVAVSAMILPGISGSLVLILMGEYFEVVSAISGLKTLNLDNMVFLGCFAVGIILGGLLFAKFINAVLKRYYNEIMAFLIGLMAGSLYALWPFKKSIIMVQQYFKTDGVIRMATNVEVYTNVNKLPQIGIIFYLSIVFFLIGGTIMYFFIKKEL